jgi:hypothetical protein
MTGARLLQELGDGVFAQGGSADGGVISTLRAG